jgi:hypothetical protein
MRRAATLGRYHAFSLYPFLHASILTLLSSCKPITVQEAWDLSLEGAAEPPYGLGPMGVEGWFVPKYTGKHDPSLLSYLGIQGQQNRRKLAETFLRPTSWGDYCTQVSTDDCKASDNVAKRPPRTATERERYFVKDVYTGHFRATEKNDCDKWPLNCTGHLVE